MSPHGLRMALLNLAWWGWAVYALGMALGWAYRALRRTRSRRGPGGG